MESDVSTKFSPSKLATYQDCPRRYRYRYVDKIKREAQSVEAFVGSCVHKAFEELYKGLLHARKMTLDEVLAVFEEEWRSTWSDWVVIRNKGVSPEDWRNVGRECVRGYYLAHAPFDSDKTVAVEKRIGFPLEAAGARFQIEGFIDRLALAPDGAFEIHDYKTGANLPPQRELDEDWQLAIYELAVRHAWPDTKAVRLFWHYVRPGKDLASSRRPEELAALKGEIAALIESIKRDHDFVPRKSGLCDWCEYRDICPLWAHAETVARLNPEQLRREDGVKLVGELAANDAKRRELKESLKELERDQQAIEGALVRYAEEKGLLAVSGLEGEASIVEKDDYKFPTKTHSPDALEALEKELKATPLWNEVSHLDSHRLVEGYKRKLWAEPLLTLVESLLSRYVKRAREKTVRFHRKRESEDE